MSTLAQTASARSVAVYISRDCTPSVNISLTLSPLLLGWSIRSSVGRAFKVAICALARFVAASSSFS